MSNEAACPQETKPANPNDSEFYCQNCGSDNVEVAMWVNPNTNAVGDVFGSWGEDDSSYCNNCQMNGTLDEDKPEDIDPNDKTTWENEGKEE